IAVSAYGGADGGWNARLEPLGITLLKANAGKLACGLRDLGRARVYVSGQAAPVGLASGDGGRDCG
ncbi:MAG: hypothetical protein ABFD96_00905, partial [Armatimonadia bacterium]